MDKLLPCPFCGGTPILELFNDGFCDYARIRCCRVIFDWRGDKTGEQAIAAWNRRAGDDTNVATNADRIRSMSKVRLVFARTETDNVTNTWTAVKTVEVELPFENATHGWEKWQLIGAEWP